MLPKKACAIVSLGLSFPSPMRELNFTEVQALLSMPRETTLGARAVLQHTSTRQWNAGLRRSGLLKQGQAAQCRMTRLFLSSALAAQATQAAQAVRASTSPTLIRRQSKFPERFFESNAASMPTIGFPTNLPKWLNKKTSKCRRGFSYFEGKVRMTHSVTIMQNQGLASRFLKKAASRMCTNAGVIASLSSYCRSECASTVYLPRARARISFSALR